MEGSEATGVFVALTSVDLTEAKAGVAGLVEAVLRVRTGEATVSTTELALLGRAERAVSTGLGAVLAVAVGLVVERRLEACRLRASAFLELILDALVRGSIVLFTSVRITLTTLRKNKGS